MRRLVLNALFDVRVMVATSFLSSAIYRLRTHSLSPFFMTVSVVITSWRHVDLKKKMASRWALNWKLKELTTACR